MNSEWGGEQDKQWDMNFYQNEDVFLSQRIGTQTWIAFQVLVNMQHLKNN